MPIRSGTTGYTAKKDATLGEHRVNDIMARVRAATRLNKQKPMRVSPTAERFYQDQYRHRLKRYACDMFEHEDVSLLDLWIVLSVGIVLLLLGAWFFCQRIPVAAAKGFNTDIVVKSSAVFPWTIHIPAHLWLLLPTVLCLLAFAAFYGYRRYTQY